MLLHSSGLIDTSFHINELAFSYNRRQSHQMDETTGSTIKNMSNDYKGIENMSHDYQMEECQSGIYKDVSHDLPCFSNPLHGAGEGLQPARTETSESFYEVPVDTVA